MGIDVNTKIDNVNSHNGKQPSKLRVAVQPSEAAAEDAASLIGAPRARSGPQLPESDLGRVGSSHQDPRSDRGAESPHRHRLDRRLRGSRRQRRPPDRGCAELSFHDGTDRIEIIPADRLGRRCDTRSLPGRGEHRRYGAVSTPHSGLSEGNKSLGRTSWGDICVPSTVCLLLLPNALYTRLSCVALFRDFRPSKLEAERRRGARRHGNGDGRTRWRRACPPLPLRASADGARTRDQAEAARRPKGPWTREDLLNAELRSRSSRARGGTRALG
eukprot:scaffold40399_cov67-Phaeocystis_antarctica.AAC.2